MSKKVTETSSSKLIELVKNELKNKANINHSHNYAASNHNHDSVYSKLGHTHDDRYYTESEINNLLAGKSNTNHTHSGIPSNMVDYVVREEDIGKSTTEDIEKYTYLLFKSGIQILSMYIACNPTLSHFISMHNSNFTAVGNSYNHHGEIIRNPYNKPQITFNLHLPYSFTDHAQAYIRFDGNHGSQRLWTHAIVNHWGVGPYLSISASNDKGFFYDTEYPLAYFNLLLIGK